MWRYSPQINIVMSEISCFSYHAVESWGASEGSSEGKASKQNNSSEHRQDSSGTQCNKF